MELLMMRKDVIEVRDKSKMTEVFDFYEHRYGDGRKNTVVFKQIVFESLALTTGAKTGEMKSVVTEKEEVPLGLNSIQVDCVNFSNYQYSDEK